MSRALAMLEGRAARGEEGQEIRSRLPELVQAWRKAAQEGLWRPLLAAARAQESWDGIASSMAQDLLGEEGLGKGAAPASFPGTPQGALERVSTGLEAWLEAREGHLGDGLRPDPDLWPVLHALAWWCWQGEWEDRPLAWRGGLQPPSHEALSVGLLACLAEGARLETLLQARRLPAYHPVSRITQGLQDHLEDLWRSLEALAVLLGGSPSLRERYVAWQGLCLWRSRLASLQEGLVCLPGEEVPPVLYTLLETVFSPLLAIPLTVTAIPGSMLRLGARIAGPGAYSRPIPGGVAWIAREDVNHPLAWPVAARSVVLTHSFASGFLVPAGQRQQGGHGGGSQAFGEAEHSDELREATADLVTLAAFGPSYPLAMATVLGSRRPLAGATTVGRRALLFWDLLEGEGFTESRSRRWIEALLQLDPPCEPAAPSSSGVSVDWEAGWQQVLASSLDVYRPARSPGVEELLQGLEEGRLISAYRRGPAAPAPAQDVAPRETYLLLQQVRDVPASSAEILHAGWRFLVESFANGPWRAWLEEPSGPGRVSLAQRLAALDAILMRSLDVAAVHRLYVGNPRPMEEVAKG